MPWACLGHDRFLHPGNQAIALERMKLDMSNLVCRLNVKSIAITCVKVLQHGGVHSGSRDLLNFWKISANISETVQDRDIDIVEDYEITCAYRMASV